MRIIDPNEGVERSARSVLLRSTEVKQSRTARQDSARLESSVPLRWLTTSEAGAYVKLSVKTLERMRSEHVGPRYHVAGLRTVRYDIADLDTWLLRQGGDR